MATDNNARTIAFLEDLNMRLKRFDEMIAQARDEITRALARYEAHAINSDRPTLEALRLESDPYEPENRFVEARFND